MFWKKKEENKPLVTGRTECNQMAQATLKASGVNFDSSDGITQAIVGTFIFGMIQTHGMLKESFPVDIHAIAIAVFMDSLHYTAEAATEGVQQCIKSTEPRYHDTMHAILHRGIDGHKQYMDGDLHGLGENLRSILNQLTNQS